MAIISMVEVTKQNSKNRELLITLESKEEMNALIEIINLLPKVVLIKKKR